MAPERLSGSSNGGGNPKGALRNVRLNDLRFIAMARSIGQFKCVASFKAQDFSGVPRLVRVEEMNPLRDTRLEKQRQVLVVLLIQFVDKGNVGLHGFFPGLTGIG